MAATASGVTIPGTSPTTTPATPIQDHWNNLGKSLNPLVIVPTASVTTRAALVTARNAEGPAISASAPLYVFRADAGAGFELEVTTNGTTFRTLPSTAGAVAYIPVLGPGATPYTAAGEYIQQGKLVTYWFNLTCGAAFGMSAGSATISLPVTADTSVAVSAGAVRLYDASTGNAIFGARPALATSTTLAIQTSATYAGALAFAAYNFPWTWAAGDIIDGFITYPAA